MYKNKDLTIGILTSGGDAPGMNAAIRAVVRTAINNGIKVVGIKAGYEGIFNKDFVELNLRSVSNIINTGGTFLYTARSEKMMAENGVKEASEILKEKGINCLIVIGGDGSFRGMLALCKYGINCIGIPGTIDNDIGCSDYTIGYDTAMNTAMEMIDKLRDTASSHHRCSIVEVMGRNAGYIALNTGIACGATAMLIPEMDVDIKKYVIEKIEESKKLGRQHFLVVVAEGLNMTNEIYEYVKKNIDMDVRLTILGHVQRGGTPTLSDRVIASKLGFTAVELIKNGIVNQIVALENNKIINLDINEALEMKKNLDIKEIYVAEHISI